MGLHYFTFMGKNLENEKKLTPIWIMNSMNNVSIFNDSVTMNSVLSE